MRLSSNVLKAQEKQEQEVQLPMHLIVKNLFLNPTYILSVLAITNVMFILTAL